MILNGTSRIRSQLSSSQIIHFSKQGYLNTTLGATSVILGQLLFFKVTEVIG